MRPFYIGCDVVHLQPKLCLCDCMAYLWCITFWDRSRKSESLKGHDLQTPMDLNPCLYLLNLDTHLPSRRQHTSWRECSSTLNGLSNRLWDHYFIHLARAWIMGWKNEPTAPLQITRTCGICSPLSRTAHSCLVISREVRFSGLLHLYDLQPSHLIRRRGLP